MEMTPEVKAVRDEILAAIDTFKGAAQADIDTLKKAVAQAETKEALDVLRQRIERMETRYAAPDEGTVEQKSPGQRFIESAELKSFVDRGWHKGGCAVKLPPPFERKTTISISAVGRATTGVVPIQRLPAGFVAGAERALRIRDLLPSQRTDAGIVDFIRENVFTSAASPQAEASDKGESALTFTAVSAIVRTIAHWIPASRQVLQDVAGLRDFIDRKLLYGLRLKEETEILNGDGLGEHLNGICTQAISYAGTYLASGDTKLDTLRHAILEVEMADYPCDFFVLNPDDVHDIELIKEEAGGVNKGKYVVGDPKDAGLLTLWGRPVIASNSMTAGKFLAGAATFGAEIFDRMDATIDISTEHSDYFIKNLVAIRCEERIALVVYRPASFRYGSF